MASFMTLAPIQSASGDSSSDEESYYDIPGFREFMSQACSKPSKFEEFDKSQLVKEHEMHRLLSNCGESAGLVVVKHNKAFKNREAGSLSDLSPITIGELQEGRRHGGKVLFGTLCVDAFHMRGVMSVLEDEAGQAVRLAIYNMPSVSIEEIQKRLPKGQYVAIREPLCKRTIDGKFCVRVNNVANIEFVKHETPMQKDPDLEKLKSEGNRLFGQRNWKGAIAAYTKCIDAYNGTPESKELVTQALSNRSEAWMKLQDYVKSLADASSALKLDATHVKSIFRKARALYCLQDYDRSMNCLQVAHANAPSAKDVKELMHKCTIAIAQSAKGIYELASYLQRDAPEPPECSDYIGPVSIRTGKDGNGLGLFATTNVKVGELLLVCNPLALGRGGIRSQIPFLGHHSCLPHSKNDLVDEVVSVVNNSSRAMEQITYLDSAWKDNHVKVPSMELYKPNNNWFSYITEAADNNRKIPTTSIDKKLIRRVVKRHAFGSERDSGLWVLASFIKHSCLPNASWFLVGKTLFVHAGRRIQADEQITAPYFESLRPFRCRQDSCYEWGFKCSCKRCVFEGSIQKPFEMCLDQYEALLSTVLQESGVAAGMICPSAYESSAYESDLPSYTELGQLALHVEDAIASLYNLKEEEKQWIKASYAASYLAAFQSLVVLKESFKKISSGMQIVQALQASVPGHEGCLGLISRMAATAMVFFGEDEPDKSPAQSILKLATEIFESLYGVHEPSVVRSMLLGFSKMRLFSGSP